MVIKLQCNNMNNLLHYLHDIPKTLKSVSGIWGDCKGKRCNRSTFWCSIAILATIASVIFIPQYIFFYSIPNLLWAFLLFLDIVSGIIILWLIASLWQCRMNDAGVNIWRLLDYEILLGISIWLCYLFGAKEHTPYGRMLWITTVEDAYDGYLKLVAYILYGAFYLLIVLELILCFKPSIKKESQNH